MALESGRLNSFSLSVLSVVEMGSLFQVYTLLQVLIFLENL